MLKRNTLTVQFSTFRGPPVVSVSDVRRESRLFRFLRRFRKFRNGGTASPAPKSNEMVCCVDKRQTDKRGSDDVSNPFSPFRQNNRVRRVRVLSICVVCRIDGEKSNGKNLASHFDTDARADGPKNDCRRRKTDGLQ